MAHGRCPSGTEAMNARTGTVGESAKEEARLREVVVGEVLDTRPTVRWSDIAGLAGAKQVSPCPDPAHLRCKVYMQQIRLRPDWGCHHCWCGEFCRRTLACLLQHVSE